MESNEALRMAAEQGDAAAMRRAVGAGADIHAKNNEVRGSTVVRGNVRGRGKQLRYGLQ